MVLNPEQIPKREKLILTGLYLSKYDQIGLRKLGFGSFVEAFNVVGYGMGSQPASVKNYRDEFDPVFPNRRKGWHKRAIRPYCLKVLEEYRNLDLESFTALVKSFMGHDENLWSQFRPRREWVSQSHFAERLTTGLAAERYFESVRHGVPEFKGYAAENTTQLGCGYDFRLRRHTGDDFLAVEVKGLKDRTGTLSMTPKEYDVAMSLRDRFFLFVVKDFRRSPFHEIFQNPLSGRLRFRKGEKMIVQVSWMARV